MRRFPLPLIAIVAAVSLSMSVAAASPPSGQLTFEDHGRAQVIEGGDVATPGGTSAFLGTFSLAPGASSGWRAMPGQSILAVTAGSLTVHRGDGCEAEKVAAGNAVVVPAGAVALANAGDSPAAGAGAFFNLPAGGADPLAGGAPAPAPSGCAGVAPADGLTSAELGRGTFVALDHYQGHGMQASEVNPVQAGQDVLFSTYHLEPGASSGWINHRGQFGVMTQGTLTYYEAHDGQCVKTDAYSAGSAFFHGPHNHMAVNEGNEPLTVTIAHFNVPHNDHPAPVVGNQGDAFDFTPLPPADCPRLR